MKISNSVSAVILAGGKSTRYNGENKALISIKGQSILELQLKVLQAAFTEIIIVGHRNDELIEFASGVKFTEDIFHDFGPLAGIYAGLLASESNTCFVFSCDMPFIELNVIQAMLSAFELRNTDILIPSISGNIEPLFALYSKKISTNLKLHIENSQGNSIRSFIFKHNFDYFELEDNFENKRCFYNINSKIDLQNLLK